MCVLFYVQIASNQKHDLISKHKIMTLRDDIVFFIFLIQAYIYRVDKSRCNEFGYSYNERGHKEDVGEEVSEHRGDDLQSKDKLE